MKIWLAASLCLSLGIPVLAEAQTYAELKAKYQRWRYIDSTRPKRTEAYLRSENITDQEVRELQGIARKVLPDAIVNIGGVTSDCPCEDGPKCTAQVWIVAYDPEETVGLMFSNIDSHWEIGPVQSWWLRRDDLYERQPRWGDRDKYFAWLEEQEALYAAFPACATVGSP